jgi:hypothetical protein
MNIKLDLIIERNDSKYVPWEIIEDNTEYPDDYPCWSEDRGCIESGVWPLDAPADPETTEAGERFHVKGDAYIEFEKIWTDCGYEYDAYLNWNNGDVTITKIEPCQCGE